MENIKSAIAQVQAHPVTCAIKLASVSSYNGFQAVWAFEKENEFGRSVAIWLFDIFVAIALPLILLAWSGVVALYRIARKPETRQYISGKFAAASNFIGQAYTNGGQLNA